MCVSVHYSHKHENAPRDVQQHVQWSSPQSDCKIAHFPIVSQPFTVTSGAACCTGQKKTKQFLWAKIGFRPFCKEPSFLHSTGSCCCRDTVEQRFVNKQTRQSHLKRCHQGMRLVFVVADNLHENMLQHEWMVSQLKQTVGSVRPGYDSSATLTEWK